jgi:superfamily II DNA or RNA helicase
VIIGDEVHNYGSEEMIKKLPNSINLRMGLSATPERHMDAEGTKAIFDYFGKSVEPIVTLSDALDWEVLTKYYYHPIQTTLNDDEYDEYEQITGKISKLVAMGHSIDDNSSSSLNYLLIQRARIISSCENKIPKLKKLIKSLMSKEKPDKFLVYCGDGKVDSSTTDDEVKQIEEVTRLLGKELGLIVSRYTAETKLDDREKMQLDIASGEIDGIVAIRCLDEGVDIPEVDTAFILASSSNPKQFIQRRGRVLRRAPDKEYATIYDFIVTPPEYSEVTEMDRKLLEKELNRCIEFADMSENKFSARGSLIDIMKKYDLLYI